jgi:hypothetical protein
MGHPLLETVTRTFFIELKEEAGLLRNGLTQREKKVMFDPVYFLAAAFSSATTPGNCFPMRNSMRAPPAVLT